MKNTSNSTYKELAIPHFKQNTANAVTPAVAMERSANQGDFRANLSKGGTGKVVELTEAEQAICIKAAQAVSLSFAGVDLMREGTKSYVTEVNGNPGTRIIEIAGHNYFVDLVSYVTGMVAKETKEEKVKQELPTPEPVQIVDLTNPMHLAKHIFEKWGKKAG